MHSSQKTPFFHTARSQTGYAIFVAIRGSSYSKVPQLWSSSRSKLWRWPGRDPTRDGMALVHLHRLAPALLASQPLPLLHSSHHRLRPLHAKRFQSQPSTPGWKDPKTLDKLTDWATAGASVDQRIMIRVGRGGGVCNRAWISVWIWLMMIRYFNFTITNIDNAVLMTRLVPLLNTHTSHQTRPTVL